MLIVMLVTLLLVEISPSSAVPAASSSAAAASASSSASLVLGAFFCPVVGSSADETAAPFLVVSGVVASVCLGAAQLCHSLHHRELG